MTAIFVTHDQYEAMSMSDDVAVMSNGQSAIWHARRIISPS